MTRWHLTGTNNQRMIARDAFADIKFPFELLVNMPGTPELGWADLNGYAAAGAAETRAHGIDKHDGDQSHPLEGEDEQGRRFTQGLIFIRSGRIYIDRSLERRPLRAKHVIGMEAFHAVDIFWMTDEQREELMRRWNVQGTTWWEVHDYAREYWRLGGEAWMYEGLGAYSDYQLGRNPFAHDAGVEPEDVWRILGVQRTDYVPPAPPPPPPPPPEPTPEPVATPAVIVSYGKSNIFHRLGHFANRKNMRLVDDRSGMRPCKVCKP